MKVVLLFLVATLVERSYGIIGSIGCAFMNPCRQVCKPTGFIGESFQCSCHQGFQVSASNSYECVPVLNMQCQPGYQSFNGLCIDINECENSPCQHVCTNNQGNYTCSCNSGFRPSLQDWRRCEPIEISCPRGYRSNPSRPDQCIDIDECAVNSPCEHYCSNSQGSFECSCRSGFRISEYDTTRCTASVANCPEGYRPSLADPRECEAYNRCPAGYRPSTADPRECQDIDECANTGSELCQQVCTNTRGSYRCSCREGYAVSERDPSRCVVSDPCSSNPCQHNCTRTTAGFACSCRRGYQLSGSTNCEDINECTTNNRCEQICTNTEGSFRCSCREGFVVNSADKTKCSAIAVDACSQGRRCEQICTVIPGGRKCSCRDGFAVSNEDETVCDEIEKCKTKVDVFFVIDGSNSIGGKDFQSQLAFCRKLVTNFYVGPNDVRFGGMQFSRNVDVIFKLNTHNDVRSIQKALTNVVYMNSSTDTHKALQTIDTDKLLSPENGGRNDAKKVIALFTDGDPSRVQDTLAAADALQRQNVRIVVIGIGTGLKMDIMRQIASSPEDALAATSYDKIEYIEKTLTNLLCQGTRTG